MAEKTDKVTLKKVPQKELSIIKIVEEMVREGRPEKEIISALKAVGVKEEQAKKLLDIAEDLDSEAAKEKWLELAELVIMKHRLFEITRGKAI
ncbi:hypothetical protein KJ660_02960 [Candidatus Micrarchaeota archaeon]|nr:hypothetical protein [Candidatus Micrarchaeota archaeon]